MSLRADCSSDDDANNGDGDGARRSEWGISNKKHKRSTSDDSSSRAAAAAAAAGSDRTTVDSLRRSPPDPIRYVRLWGRRTTTTAAAEEASTLSTTTMASHTTLEEELELANYNLRIWESIDEACQRRQRPQAPDAAGPSNSSCTSTSATPNVVVDNATIIDLLYRELDRVTVLPRLLSLSRGRLDYGLPASVEDLHGAQRFWDQEVTQELKYDREVAWAIIGAAMDPSITPYHNSHPPRLPLPFLQMLWTDEDCPLRSDRDLMLASLEDGLHASIHVAWSSLLENDRELLIKVFERSPWSLNNADVPLPYLEDRDLFLSFVRSKRLKSYRDQIRNDDTRSIVNRFSPQLLNDPGVLAELAATLDEWSHGMVARSGIATDAMPRHPLLNDQEFVLLVVERMRANHSYCRESSPVQFERLSPELKASRDVILAFAALDPSGGVWRGCPITWSSAVDDGGGQVTAVSWDGSHPHDLRQLPYPQEIATDRDAAVRAVFLRSIEVGINWKDWTTLRRIQDREFWIQMAETHLCPVRGWGFIPKDIAADPAVILAWARHATTLTPRWVFWADDKAGVLSDRQAVRNCLLQMLNSYYFNVWGYIDDGRQVLDQSLWVDVLSRLDAEPAMVALSMLSEELIRDRGVVGAALRCGIKAAQIFLRMFCSLPLEMQLQHTDLLLKALRNRRGDDEGLEDALRGLSPELYHLPEVVDAALSCGWCPWNHVGIRNIVKSAPWSKDRSYLLSMARRYPASSVWYLFTDDARRDKDVIVSAVRVNAEMWRYLSYDRQYDIDVLCGALSGPGGNDILLRCLSSRDFAHRPENDPASRLHAFAIEVRRRLVAHLSLTAVMGGIRQGPSSSAASPTPVLSMLNQDPDTVQALEDRFAALLGAPTDPNDIADCRRASNALTRYGY